MGVVVLSGILLIAPLLSELICIFSWMRPTRVLENRIAVVFPRRMIKLFRSY